MLDFAANDFNFAIDLDLFALQHDQYDDSQLSFEETEEELDGVEEREQSRKRMEEEEPYTAY